MRIDGLRVVLYFNDHKPAHVHVRHGDKDAIFDLNCPDGPAKVREAQNLTRSQVDRVEEELTGRVREVCREWEIIHGGH